MMNKFIIVGILVTTGFACAEKDYRSSSSQTTTIRSTKQPSERNVAAESEMDKSEGKTLTPTDQIAGSKADVELTRQIRKAIADSDALSMSAQNVKIITLKGITTLRGPVNTMAEKMKIEELAKTAGARTIKNQLEVTTKTE